MNTDSLLDHLFRHQSGRIIAHLTRLLGPQHLETAEEAVQEAMLRALQTWPDQGAPQNAPAWLFRVANNAAIDAVRRDKTGGQKSAEFVEELNRSALNIPGDRILKGNSGTASSGSSSCAVTPAFRATAASSSRSRLPAVSTSAKSPAPFLRRTKRSPRSSCAPAGKSASRTSPSTCLTARSCPRGSTQSSR